MPNNDLGQLDTQDTAYSSSDDKRCLKQEVTISNIDGEKCAVYEGGDLDGDLCEKLRNSLTSILRWDALHQSGLTLLTC